MSAGNLHVEVQGRDIIVTLPGTNFMVTYFKPAGTSHLIARPNWTNDPDASIELGEFLEQALTAANTKAWAQFDHFFCAIKRLNITSMLTKVFVRVTSLVPPV